MDYAINLVQDSLPRYFSKLCLVALVYCNDRNIQRICMGICSIKTFLFYQIFHVNFPCNFLCKFLSNFPLITLLLERAMNYRLEIFFDTSSILHVFCLLRALIIYNEVRTTNIQLGLRNLLANI